MSHFDEVALSRPIESFRDVPPSVLIEYDASLAAVGVGVSVRVSSTGEFTLIGYTSVVFPFGNDTVDGDQNTCEYIAVLVGLLLASTLGLSGFAYNVRGDSKSSLSWVMRDRAPSVLAHKTNIVMTLASVHIKASPHTSSLIPSKSNFIYDALSRGRARDTLDLSAKLFIPIPRDHAILQLIELCNPTTTLLGAHEHATFTSDIIELLSSLQPLSIPVDNIA